MKAARARMLDKLQSLGDIVAMPKAEWDKFLNELPRDEFVELITWCAEHDSEVSKNTQSFLQKSKGES